MLTNNKINELSRRVSLEKLAEIVFIFVVSVDIVGAIAVATVFVCIVAHKIKTALTANERR